MRIVSHNNTPVFIKKFEINSLIQHEEGKITKLFKWNVLYIQDKTLQIIDELYDEETENR